MRDRSSCRILCAKGPVPLVRCRLSEGYMCVCVCVRACVRACMSGHVMVSHTGRRISQGASAMKVSWPGSTAARGEEYSGTEYA
jgi:hypothetical protein